MFRKSVWGQFAIIVLPIFIIFAVITAAILYQRSRDELIQLQNDERRISKIHENIISHAFSLIASDLMTLSAHTALRSFLDHPSELVLRDLAGEFLAFSQYRGIYDQVRYLDDTGMEVIRVDYKNGKSLIIPDEQLQKKGDRYYFTDTIKLDRGDIFVSPFDLNVERGEIERPFKPMLRFATPVFDSLGVRKGIIILNYLGGHLFKYMDEIGEAMNSRVSILLLNQQGYWLRGLRSEDEWGFMFKDKTRSFSHALPLVWEQMLAGKSGTFNHSTGLYTFRTIHPLLGELVSSTGSVETTGISKEQIGVNDYFWKLVAYVPAALLTEDTRALFDTMKPFILATMLLLSIGAFFMARKNIREALDKENIERLAHFDVLTGLPNRAFLYDRIDQLIALEERYQEHFALLFVDLDGFKSVNDEYGHDAGDMVLKETAFRIKGVIRKLDTVARIGGDEFLITLADLKKKKDACFVAERIVMSMHKPFLIQDHQQVMIGASIGISIHPDDGEDMDTLMKHADEAMYQAKNSGKNAYRFYSD